MSGVLSRHQHTTRRRAYGRSCIKLRETHPLARHPIEVRRLYEFLAETPYLAVTQIIRENENDVRFCRRSLSGESTKAHRRPNQNREQPHSPSHHAFKPTFGGANPSR